MTDRQSTICLDDRNLCESSQLMQEHNFILAVCLSFLHLVFCYVIRYTCGEVIGMSLLLVPLNPRIFYVLTSSFLSSCHCFFFSFCGLLHLQLYQDMKSMVGEVLTR